MAIFNQPVTKRETTPVPPPPESLMKKPEHNEFSLDSANFPPSEPAPMSTPSPTPSPMSSAPVSTAPSPTSRPLSEGKESVIASDLSIEGKIQGSGHIRIAGRFKGDVQVDGDLTVELGAKLNGGVKARKVVIAGELEGNIESAERVEVVNTGVVVGDIKAGNVTVAPGARMRGQVEFGWEEGELSKRKNDQKAKSGASSDA